MAVREYHVEVTSTEGNEELYLHDNNAIERVTLPVIETVEHTREHTEFLLRLTCYLRCHKCSKLEVTKVP
jgi:hypothetical protein